MPRNKKPTQAAAEAAESQSTQSRVRWQPEVVASIAEWFSRRNPKTGRCDNANYYLKGVKIESAKRCFDELNLGAILPGATPQKLVEKLAHMMSMFKDQRDRADSTGWGVDPDGHNQPPQGQGHIAGAPTIRSIILNKVPWYYEFEEVMSERPNVTPAFLSESGQPDRRNLKPVGPDGETIEGDDNSVTEDDAADDTDEELSWDPTQSERDPVSAASPDEVDEEVNNAMEVKARIEREIKAKVQELVARSEANNALLAGDVGEDSTNPHDLTQGSSPPPVARASVSKATKSAKDAVTSKPSAPPKTSAPAPATVPAPSKTPAKSSTQAESSKKSKKRVKETYEIESDSEKERDRKKKKTEPKQRSVADALVEVEDKRIKLAMAQSEAELRERRLQLDREALQRDREAKRQDQQHEERMLQMRIQLAAMEGKGMEKKKEEPAYSSFDSQDLDDYYPMQ